MRAVIRYLADRPWIFVVLAFGALIAAWSAAIFLSRQVPLDPIPLDKPTPPARTR